MSLRPKVQVLPTPRVQRKLRSPQHAFQLRTRPWQVQPFLLAPVLPGETMKNLLLQARVVTDPIKNPLIGWWCEYYFFYTKIRDLAARDQLTNMFVDPAFSMSGAGLTAAASTDYYHFGGHVNWSALCYFRVIDEYFRFEGESTGAGTIGSMFSASVNTLGALDSARLTSEITAKDFDVDSADANTTIQASEVEAALAKWQMLRFNNMTEMTYDEYLQSYGVHPRATEEHVPELIRYVREWQYPTSHVEPTTGVPSSAVSWKIAERADKDRFFKEPGFITGYQVIRPKVYMSKSIGSYADLMEDLLRWLPAPLAGEVSHSLLSVANGASGPLSLPAAPYTIDLRDLLLYGDQFLNFALTETDAGLVALPDANLQKRYASGADADALFKAAAPANQIRTDGVVHLNILGRQQDLTATS